MSEIMCRYMNNFTFKLLSGFSVFFSVLFVSSLSFAVTPDFETSVTPPVIVPELENVLWDQSDNPSDKHIVSQAFIDGGGVFDIYDARAADDFLVPDELYWSIQTVKVFGTYDITPDPVQSIDIVFFTNKKDTSDDNMALPGDPVHMCVYKDVLPEDANDPNFVINLPHPCVLMPGRYWVSVQANMLFVPHGQWFWNERTVQTLSPFAWENPGNGFGTGCIVFSHADSDCGANFPDLNFQLIGEELPPPVVPTLSEWGMAAMAGVLGIIGFLAVRRREVKS